MELADNNLARELAGRGQRRLETIEQALGVRIGVRGNVLTVHGPEEARSAALELLGQLQELASEGRMLEQTEIGQAAKLFAKGERPEIRKWLADVILVTSRRKSITPRSPNQKRYVDAIRNHDVVFGIGPAGTGKTYLAVAMAVAMLTRGDVRKIILTRPAVEAGEKLGFLPGDLAEKIDPYLRPLYDALNDMLDPGRLGRYFEQGTIEIAPLAFMRGRTLERAFIILDEAQNTTKEQMKMFLTRIGMGSRAVVTGDHTQIDLPSGQGSGLLAVRRILRGIDEIPFVAFDRTDVVRHPLVQRIIEAYENDDAAHAARHRAGDGA
ncbi:MAG: PhoH family protein [Deltaproteobacteria bacterium]|nr:PhoH family protein [Deltaproteobacteria bacterium]